MTDRPDEKRPAPEHSPNGEPVGSCSPPCRGCGLPRHPESCINALNAALLSERAAREKAEADELEMIAQRDLWEERVDQLADALGDETEWSNLNCRFANALEIAESLVSEREKSSTCHDNQLSSDGSRGSSSSGEGAAGVDRPPGAVETPAVSPNLKELRRLAEASTEVVGWYPYSQYDGYHLGRASVRGPFGRWFLVEGGDNGMGDPVKFPTPVADLFDDAKFAAAAMNNLVPLLNLVESYQELVEWIFHKCSLASDPVAWTKVAAFRKAQAAKAQAVAPYQGCDTNNPCGQRWCSSCQ